MIAIAVAQRPGYLAGPTHPELASRFRTDNEDNTATNLNNRLGVIDGTTQKIPVDARGDYDLVNRFKDWPRQNIPFWFLNAEHIEKHRNPQGNHVSQNLYGQQNQIISEENYRRRPIYLSPRFGEYDYSVQSRYNSDEDSSEFTRRIQPVQRRPFFAGPL
mgnify:CR=1 FL=1